MPTLFEPKTTQEIVERINQLQPNSQHKWGKMNVAQMMKHCTQWDEMALGRRKYKQSFLGKLVGKFALKDMMKDEPMKRNLPTVPSFKIKEDADVTEEKTKWIKLLNEYEHFSNDNFIHPFFGVIQNNRRVTWLINIVTII